MKMEIDESVKNKMKNRKKILNEHYDEYKELKNKGDAKGAWEQLMIILKYANETLIHSSEILKKIKNDLNMSKINIEKNKEKKKKNIKFIVLPKKSSIH